MSTNAVDTPRRRMPVQLRKLAPWLAGLVLVAGIVAAIVHFAPNRNAPAQPVSKTPPPKPAAAPKTVKLSKEATGVARQFVQTAVGRKDLAAAWKISGPDLRGGLTHKEWMTGNIPVVPYPVKSLAVARFKIDYSYKNAAAIEIALLPKDGAKIKPQVFGMVLARVRGHWLVNSWVPASAPVVPQGTN